MAQLHRKRRQRGKLRRAATRGLDPGRGDTHGAAGHVDAPVNLRIPPGTPNGRTFRVRGKGVRRSDGTQGDLLIKVDVQVPTELTDDARNALEKFRDATTGANPRDELLRKGRT